MCSNWVCFANYSQAANYWKCWHWASYPILFYSNPSSAYSSTLIKLQ